MMYNKQNGSYGDVMANNEFCLLNTRLKPPHGYKKFLRKPHSQKRNKSIKVCNSYNNFSVEFTVIFICGQVTPTLVKSIN